MYRFYCIAVPDTFHKGPRDEPQEVLADIYADQGEEEEDPNEDVAAEEHDGKFLYKCTYTCIF